MFESIEIRNVANGYVVTVHTEEETNEYIFDTHRKTLKFVRTYLIAANEESD